MWTSNKDPTKDLIVCVDISYRYWFSQNPTCQLSNSQQSNKRLGCNLYTSTAQVRNNTTYNILYNHEIVNKACPASTWNYDYRIHLTCGLTISICNPRRIPWSLMVHPDMQQQWHRFLMGDFVKGLTKTIQSWYSRRYRILIWNNC